MDAKKDVDLFRLEIGGSGDNDYNFKARINPDFLGLYTELSRTIGEPSVKLPCKELSYGDGTMITTDAQGKFSSIESDILSHPTDTSKTDRDHCNLEWDPEKGLYSSKGIKTPEQLGSLIQLLLQEINYVSYEMEKLGYSISFNILSESRMTTVLIKTSPVFMERHRKLAYSEQNLRIFRNSFAEKIGEEIQTKWSELYHWVKYLIPHELLSFRNEGHLEGIRVDGAGDVSISLWGSSTHEVIQKEGGKYNTHNVDTPRIYTALLIIFWLFTEKVREFHGVDFFPTE